MSAFNQEQPQHRKGNCDQRPTKGYLGPNSLETALKSLFCLRCVSKAFSRSVDDPSFIALHKRLLVDAMGAVDVPQLLAAKNVRSSSSSNFVALQSVKYDGSSLTKGNYAVKVTSSMYLHFVFQNLFGFRLCGDEQQFLLVNPQRRGEVMRLPTSSNIQHPTRNKDPEVTFVYYYGMGFDKTGNKHKIVRVRRICREAPYDYRLLYAGTHVLELGTTSWLEIDSAVPGNWRLLDGVCAFGDMHWLNRSTLHSGIITFDFAKEGFYLNPTPPGSFSSNKNLHLLTIRGALAIVTTSSSADMTQIEIWVMKDYDRKVWMQEYTVNVGVFSDFGLKFATCGVVVNGNMAYISIIAAEILKIVVHLFWIQGLLQLGVLYINWVISTS
nr:MYB transcription factor protein [Rosa persica]